MASNGMMPIIYNTSHQRDFVEKSVEAIETFLLKRFKERRILRVALSGGQSPIPVYQALAHSKKIEWSRIQLFLVDERYVPLNSEDSNYRMIQESLIEPAGNVRKFYSYNTRETLKKLAAQYQAMLELLKPPLFDLVILGLGADGHTASLFPHDPALHESRRLVVHTVRPGAEPQDRLTLTFPAILSSEKIVFLVQGKNKAVVLDRWLHGSASLDDLPAKGVLAHPDIEVFYCGN